MKGNDTYSRVRKLFEKYEDFIKSVKERETEQRVSLSEIIELKSTLSNVNNIITLLATRAVVCKIADAFAFGEEKKRELIKDIDRKGPNANGYDIRLENPKILVEVKCNTLINGKKWGAGQLRSMQNDVLKLYDPNKKHKKASDAIQSTDEYLKILAVVNFAGIDNDSLVAPLTKEVKCKEGTSEDRKMRKETWKVVRLLKEPLQNVRDIHDKVHLLVLTRQDLEDSFNQVLGH